MESPLISLWSGWTLASVGGEELLLSILIQLGLIVAAARVFAWAVRYIGQPAAVGEILAGLLLGPSLLGRVAPEFSAAVFTHETKEIFTSLSQLGLIFLLFLIGLEFDFRHLKSAGRATALVALVGIGLPFALGAGLGFYIHPTLAPSVDLLSFWLFMGTAMCITAVPILGRILIELNLIRTLIGTITITAAAAGDALGWILLATVAALVRADFSLPKSLAMLGWTLLLVAVMILAVRPLVRAWIARWPRRADGALDLTVNRLAAILVLLLLAAIASNRIGIFAIFGAFLFGAVLAGDEGLRRALSERLGAFVTAFFLPIFFTYTGLHTDLGSLTTPTLWLIAGAVLSVAVLGKLGGCTLAARAGGLTWRDSTAVGLMMNTRGLMELIVINVGYELGVIPQSLFCMLVIMALLTTVMTTPLLLLLLRNDPPMRRLLEASDFRHWLKKSP